MRVMNFKETENGKYMKAIARRYSESLMKSGYPSNTHVYELNSTFLESKLPRKDAAFLVRAKRFYSSLDFMEGIIFLNDYLEKDKNYPYWWLTYGNEDYITKERKKLECKLIPLINYLLAE